MAKIALLAKLLAILKRHPVATRNALVVSACVTVLPFIFRLMRLRNQRRFEVDTEKDTEHDKLEKIDSSSDKLDIDPKTNLTRYESGSFDSAVETVRLGFSSDVGKTPYESNVCDLNKRISREETAALKDPDENFPIKISMDPMRKGIKPGQLMFDFDFDEYGLVKDTSDFQKPGCSGTQIHLKEIKSDPMLGGQFPSIPIDGSSNKGYSKQNLPASKSQFPKPPVLHKTEDFKQKDDIGVRDIPMWEFNAALINSSANRGKSDSSDPNEDRDEHEISDNGDGKEDDPSDNGDDYDPSDNGDEDDPSDDGDDYDPSDDGDGEEDDSSGKRIPRMRRKTRKRMNPRKTVTRITPL